MVNFIKGERYWNIGFGLFAILFVGFLFDFNYIDVIDPPLEFFTIITHPIPAIFYLGSFLIAFRHSYNLLHFVASKAHHMLNYFIVIFSICTVMSSYLLYISFNLNISKLSNIWEWRALICMEAVVLFWLFLVLTMLFRRKSTHS